MNKSRTFWSGSHVLSLDDSFLCIKFLCSRAVNRRDRQSDIILFMLENPRLQQDELMDDQHLCDLHCDLHVLKLISCPTAS
ncbi:hypothetical protein CesoFtcFv8_002606 [Champsocephalus esox]|uniref:Uncharacterized protein n=2 Tax=Champsocephalus TaxID=52236 RepID=A0AAN8E6Z4_CHAGU|nr:hypothetical protein CesoFtcFv8_002606 [Champsocephalus esox]KAK5934262.1 hypothetical protein CgunFtcFv8_014676 [Champsocephalus gunnari]